jgi:8-oxo-dGTP pyrophosphatase MutT (NUDIX family)
VSTLEFQRSLPTKRMGAGLLVRDGTDRVLLVEPTYKPNWEIPGGAVDADESPRECAIREVREELGIEMTPGRLLVVDYQHPEPERTESMMFVFDGGIVDAAWSDLISLAHDEVRSWRFVSPDELAELAAFRLRRRLDHALTAVADGHTLYLENGQPHP